MLCEQLGPRCQSSTAQATDKLAKAVTESPVQKWTFGQKLGTKTWERLEFRTNRHLSLYEAKLCLKRMHVRLLQYLSNFGQKRFLEGFIISYSLFGFWA